MIAATVEELTPIIGTRPACRALGASVATIYRRRRPPELRTPRPRPTPARALTAPERQQVLDVLHSERFVDVSPEETWATLLDEGTYLCSTRTMYRVLAATTAVSGSGVLSSPTRLCQARVARHTPERAVVVGREQAEGSGEVDLVLPVRDPRRVQPLHRRLDGAVPRERPARDGADRAGDRAAADHAEDPDAARRSRRAAARQAGGLSPRGSRHHENTFAAVHLHRQSLLGVELQDAEVPARVPRAVRRHRPRPRSTAARSSTGTTTPTATPGSG